VIAVQRGFRARFKKYAPHKNNVLFKPCTTLTLHRNHRSGQVKTEDTDSLPLLRRHLGNWSRGPAVSIGSELLVAHEKLGQFPLLAVYVVLMQVLKRLKLHHSFVYTLHFNEGGGIFI
jgi:hypothetical protein